MGGLGSRFLDRNQEEKNGDGPTIRQTDSHGLGMVWTVTGRAKISRQDLGSTGNPARLQDIMNSDELSLISI